MLHFLIGLFSISLSLAVLYVFLKVENRQPEEIKPIPIPDYRKAEIRDAYIKAIETLESEIEKLEDEYNDASAKRQAQIDARKTILYNKLATLIEKAYKFDY